jgi:hypothetical protein
MHVKLLLALLALSFAASSFAAEPPLIRFGRGFAAEEQVWLMSARPDLTPNQGKRYQLKQILFQANPQRFQAYLAGEIDAGTATSRWWRAYAWRPRARSGSAPPTW